jgi:hypothetical protein
MCPSMTRALLLERDVGGESSSRCAKEVLRYGALRVWFVNAEARRERAIADLASSVRPDPGRAIADHGGAKALTAPGRRFSMRLGGC